MCGVPSLLLRVSGGGTAASTCSRPTPSSALDTVQIHHLTFGRVLTKPVAIPLLPVVPVGNGYVFCGNLTFLVSGGGQCGGDIQPVQRFSPCLWYSRLCCATSGTSLGLFITDSLALSPWHPGWASAPRSSAPFFDRVCCLLYQSDLYQTDETGLMRLAPLSTWRRGWSPGPKSTLPALIGCASPAVQWCKACRVALRSTCDFHHMAFPTLASRVASSSAIVIATFSRLCVARTLTGDAVMPNTCGRARGGS